MMVKAYAKINLALDVLGKDKQTGYHRIQTVLQQISLHDVLIFKKISKPKIEIQSNDPELPVDEKNTVYQAIKVLCGNIKTPQDKKKKGLSPSRSKNLAMPSGIHITIQKNIPVSAGLGGGSSNAAATLLALNRLWKLHLSTKKLEKIASKIGMDVPFFIHGGTAFADHYGEKNHPLPPLKNFHALLINPGKKRSTAHAYAAIGAFKNALEKNKTRKLVSLLKNRSSETDFTACFHNDFTRLYTEKFTKMSQALYELGAQKIICTGSGPLHFAIFKNSRELDAAFQELSRSSWKVWKIKNA